MNRVNGKIISGMKSITRLLTVVLVVAAALSRRRFGYSLEKHCRRHRRLRLRGGWLQYGTNATTHHTTALA